MECRFLLERSYRVSTDKPDLMASVDEFTAAKQVLEEAHGWRTLEEMVRSSETKLQEIRGLRKRPREA